MMCVTRSQVARSQVRGHETCLALRNLFSEPIQTDHYLNTLFQLNFDPGTGQRGVRSVYKVTQEGGFCPSVMQPGDAVKYRIQDPDGKTSHLYGAVIRAKDAETLQIQKLYGFDELFDFWTRGYCRFEKNQNGQMLISQGMFVDHVT